jgi:pyridoxal phosphate enzyme (YggS family)
MIFLNLTTLTTAIRHFERQYHRPPYSVLLVAASKAQPLAKIQEAIAAGQKQFGENYLQEALTKIPALQKNPTLEWHFIGSIQSNKTRHLAEHFSWVHTVTHAKVAQRLNEQRPPELPPLNICLEINVSQEASKTGLTELAEIITLAEYCQSLPHLRLRGLMTIPAPQPTLAAQRAEFSKLASLQQMLNKQGFTLDTLSMGMTADLEAAIAEGATIVRVGRGVFGERR